MPSVVSDPSLQPGIVSMGGTIFDYPDTPAPSILNFQAVTTQPQPDRTATATGLLCPPLLITEQLKNFPPEVYGLAPSSVLVHFMQALLGPAGVGQLRQRQQFARLQSAITSTNFYDLDAFYGALFGALRGPGGTLPDAPSTGTTFSPYTQVATNDGWDDIYAIDATFRERIVQLARAITLNGTIPGLQAIAEAICGAECDVYQTWALIDSQGQQGSQGQTWSQVQSEFTTWSLAIGEPWNQVQGITLYGGMEINARNEVIIQPKKAYTSDAAGQRQQAADAWDILKVARVLAPATCIVSVSPQQLSISTPVTIATLWADSEYWEITSKVIPPQPADPAYQLLATAYHRDNKFNAPVVFVDVALPAAGPPFSQSQGTQHSYVSSISKVTSQAGPQEGGTSALDSPTEQADYETTIFPGGREVSWKPAWAFLEPARAASARASSPAALVAAPYAGPRVPVVVPG